MPGYTFVAYETGSNMYLETAEANGTWQLVYTSGTVESVYNYTLCPFFADSMSLDSIYVDWYNSVTTNDPKPGTAQESLPNSFRHPVAVYQLELRDQIDRL